MLKISPRRYWFHEYIFTDDVVIDKLVDALPKETVDAMIEGKDDDAINRALDILARSAHVSKGLELILEGKARITGFDDGGWPIFG